MSVERDMKMARKIAKEVAKIGGRAFLVGGCVRDEFLGKELKDIDIEIHNIELEDLVKILESFGKVQKIGASFGVFNLEGYGIDIAMPRKEKSNGRGHKDFDIFVDPYIGYEQAAIRRDFTINSMMKDVLTGEIIDTFGGKRDLRNKIIRHVNENSFIEDPLRVFRAAQFAARFDFSIDKKTIELCSTIDVSKLAFERVFEELKKALLKSNKPSLFFKALRDMKQLSYWFKEVEDLIGVPQPLKYHAEGDVFNHTMMVLDEASKLKEKSSDELAFMLSALCHDFGKAKTTRVDKKTGKITSYGHEVESENITRVFLKKSNRINSQKYILNMVKLHMKPNQMYAMAKKKSMMRLWDESVCSKDLILLAKADHLGRISADSGNYDEIERILNKSLMQYYEIMKLPEVTGKDLVEIGLKPGKIFSEYINLGHKMHLSGVKKDEILRHLKADMIRKKLID